VLQVLYPGLGEYEDLIQVDHQKIVCEWPQDIIHYPHEFHWSISQAKRNEQPLKEALFRFEGCLPYIN
jgi:hypothetical protein